MLTRIDLQDAGHGAHARALRRGGHRPSPPPGCPRWSSRSCPAAQGDRVVNDLTAAAVAKSAGIASALGASSAYTWLKLPVVDGHGAGHGGHDAADPAARRRPVDGARGDLRDRGRKALALPGVRGLVVGRALLFPPDGDVEAAVDTAVSLVGGS